LSDAFLINKNIPKIDNPEIIPNKEESVNSDFIDIAYLIIMLIVKKNRIL